MVLIANEWIPRLSPYKVVILLKGDEVKLFLTGKLFKDQKPDTGLDTLYGVYISGGHSWDGGNV